MSKSSGRELHTRLTDDVGYAGDRYRDFAHVPDPAASSSTKGSRNERSQKSEYMFPSRLHYMLSDIESDSSMSDIIRWQPHGRGFVVLDRKKLETDVLPMWFNQTKIESFFKQLNLYGFKRINFGRDKGCYYHELFLRGRPYLAEHIKSKPGSKSSMRVRRETPESEPDFFSMPVVENEPPRSSSPTQTADERAFASSEEDPRSSEDVHRTSASAGVTTLNSIPAAGLHALGGQSDTQGLRYLLPQTAYPSMQPLMAVASPLWMYPSGQAPFPAPVGVGGIPSSAFGLLGGGQSQFTQHLGGPSDPFAQRSPLSNSAGTIIPPYVYAAVPVSVPGAGAPLFYGHGGPRLEGLTMPHQTTDGARQSSFLLHDHSARDASVASRASTRNEERSQDTPGELDKTRRSLDGSKQDPSSLLKDDPAS